MNLGRLAGICAATLTVVSCGEESTAVSFATKERYAIATCQSAIKSGLREPDSAKFADDEVLEGVVSGSSRNAALIYAPDRGDTYFSVKGKVNAKNGFGGYTGMRPYTCEAVVGRDGTANSRARTA